MTESKKYFGHATTLDGKHVHLSEDEANAIWTAAMKAKEKRAEDMPAALDALQAISRAESRLEDLGWSKGMYCPKDGSEFAVIQYGCTGIFPAFYHGEWPKGDLHFGDEATHPHAVMWKAHDKLTDDERTKMAETEALHRQMLETEFSRLTAMDAAEI